MNLYPASAYIRHLFTARSTAGHGVHSPYMFDFITKMMRGRCDKNLVAEVESLRKEMLADRRTVTVTDLGAGSSKFSGAERRISDIAAAAALPKRETGLLARIAWGTEEEVRDMHQWVHDYEHRARGGGQGDRRDEEGKSGEQGSRKDEQGAETMEPGARIYEQGAETMEPGARIYEHGAESSYHRSRIAEHRAENAKPGVRNSEEGAGNKMRGAHDTGIILELGTSLGISTLALALAAPDKRVVTVEGCPALAEIARANFRRHAAHNAEVLNMEFSHALEKLMKEGTTVSLAFIDGNHRGEALTKYVHRIMTMGEEMIIVADDIHMNREMFTAWRSLATKETAPAALVTFRLGMLFRIRSLTPGYYRVRY